MALVCVFIEAMSAVFGSICAWDRHGDDITGDRHHEAPCRCQGQVPLDSPNIVLGPVGSQSKSIQTSKEEALQGRVRKKKKQLTPSKTKAFSSRIL